jgi:predicted phage baseplate assembly protein
MTFGQLSLDDRRFQDLVNEARGRIAHRCPEWTEHNVSDPGMTLIETFAWMTDMLVYRLNRVPEKLQAALLDLLGIELAPPAAAEAELRFRLVAPPQRPVRIPALQTEVTTTPVGGVEPLVFRVCDEFVIEPLQLEAFVLQRSGALESIPVADGVARPTGADQPAFSVPPAIGDALYLGFSRPLDRLVLRVRVEGSRARGIGIDPDAPPLSWEVSQAAQWVPVEVLEDTTSGFNEAGGRIELQMAARTAPATFAGRQLHWLRCRVTELTAAGLPSSRYTRPPLIHSLAAEPVGALIGAEHAAVEVDELLGESDGTPGQVFKLRRAPALELREGEGLEVLEPGDDDWVPWEPCETFDASGADDRHYRFNAATGEIELGPAIRTRGGGWRQHGAIPLKGARLRMSRYRHGGGERGTVARDSLRQLRNPIPGVASVTNPAPARGGVDAETVDAARRRAALELRTRYRAVTAEDFEFLAGEAPARVPRARCLDPAAGEAIPVWVLAPVADPERQLTIGELTPDEELLREVAEFLDAHRLVGTSVHVMPVPLRAVTVVVDVAIGRGAESDAVEQDVKQELFRFVNPLVGGTADGVGEGWEFGRPLNEGELYALVQEVPGVERVRMLRMYETDLRSPDAPAPQPVGARLAIAPNELLCSATHRVRARHDDDERD